MFEKSATQLQREHKPVDLNHCHFHYIFLNAKLLYYLLREKKTGLIASHASLPITVPVLLLLLLLLFRIIK
jgi:hypothetical protein